ncbi:MAG: VanW family protein [Candidatus Doudnabacteria bacterium]|nr:VanW family protein [Candidatus Doudnabacteria bacterium]
MALFFLPKLASAKTLHFQDQTWDIDPKAGSNAMVLPVRNDVSLAHLTTHALLGDKNLGEVPLLDAVSAAKLSDVMLKINQPARDAKLTLEGKIAKEFEPGQNGQGLDVYVLRQLLASSEQDINLPVIFSKPAKTLADTNNLGIRELVAVGVSDFTGSPSNRIHNVTVGATKFNGLLIDQGEEFSFNKYLGDVDDVHGFLPELVIKKSGVVPEFGGGLCQVSSTAFRAAMNAGLPITARRNHSFAVQYYAPQGTDATIYPGVVDLKFVNNLSSPILIRTRIDGRKLYFEYYGTKDDRTVSFEGPVQYDQKPDGSLKASWTRHVTLNGQTADQTFYSVYQPPALFHKEAQAATPNPEAVPTTNNQPVTQTN